MPRVVVLRWGHRPQRDARLTTHVALAARALGADGIILSDVEDKKIQEAVEKTSKAWGGSFSFQMGIPWKRAVKKWRTDGGTAVHLTVYGENIQTSDVLRRIKDSGRDVLVIVGSQKVPGEFFSEEVSDFNVAIGNQPHSECASLAVFLDRFFEGEILAKRFENAKMRVVPQKRGKKLVEIHGSDPELG
jgi:tRNA (cytidine56-2'-O)-methyltransferase